MILNACFGAKKRHALDEEAPADHSQHGRQPRPYVMKPDDDRSGCQNGPS
jgi:hypothetical protein